MASQNPTPPTTAQPKINQKLAIRTLVAVLLLGAGLFGARWYHQNQNDIANLGSADTAGMVAAVEFMDNGSKVVALDAKGTKIEPKGYRAGATERDLAWQPDGNRLFFISDRDAKNGFQVYRWKPGADEEPSPRSIGTQGKSNPSFSVEDAPDQNETLLMTSRGVVLELDPKNQKMHQVLPPPTAEITQSGDQGEGEGGSTGQFAGLYGRLGESFRIARWCGGKTAVAAVMRRDRGELLIVQTLPKGTEKVSPPAVIAAGDHIDFDVNPKDGSVVYTVQNFQWPTAPPAEFVKNGKVSRPFAHYVGLLKVGESSKMIVAVPDDRACFSSPTISPAGDRVLLVVGPYDPSSESIQPQQLVTMPTQEGGGNAVARLVTSPVFEPSWSPKGDRLVYVKRTPGGKRGIYVCNADGSGEQALSGDSGNFGSPKFSPQTK